MTATYDLVLTGGRVIDERNGIDGVNDVAIKGGKIAAVGQGLAASAAKVRDVKGLVVAPGAKESALAPLVPARTLAVIGVSSGVVRVSAAASGAAVTLIEITSVSVSAGAPLSVERTVSVAAPW